MLVSSGAIALGRRALGAAKRRAQAGGKSGGGRRRPGATWRKPMPTSSRADDIVAAQVLLTLGDTEERRRYLNARATLKTLLELGGVPVINENDTVATAEIRFGDNDRLAARVASMMEADCLVLLSDVDGLYSADPSRDAQAQGTFPKSPRSRLRSRPWRADRSPVSAAAAWRPRSIAAKIATARGLRSHHRQGRDAAIRCRDPRRRARTRIFVPQPTPAAARKRWIAGVLQAARRAGHRCGRGQGAGARQEPAARRHPPDRRALRARRCGGGARTGTGREIARGLAAYGAADAERIAGKRTRRNRGDPGLSWPRRDDPSRRSGADGGIDHERSATERCLTAEMHGALASPRAMRRARCAKPDRDKERRR